MKKSKWFPVSKKPVRVGFYDYKGLFIDLGERLLWNGEVFGYWGAGSKIWYVMEPVAGDKWRGLAKRPK